MKHHHKSNRARLTAQEIRLLPKDLQDQLIKDAVAQVEEGRAAIRKDHEPQNEDDHERRECESAD